MPHLISLSSLQVSLITFMQLLPKTLLVGHISSFIITNYFKKIVGIKSLSTRQCAAELSPGTIPAVSIILPKMFPLL